MLSIDTPLVGEVLEGEESKEDEIVVGGEVNAGILVVIGDGDAYVSDYLQICMLAVLLFSK